MCSIKEKKRQLRDHIALKKKGFSSSVLEERSEMILRKLELQPEFVHAKCLFLYYSMPDEVATHAFVKKWSDTKEIYLPVIEEGEMKLRLFSPDHRLKTGAFHILEPQGALCVDYNVIDFALVPGVAFDHQGFRLGRGKGYYDRVLPLLRCVKAGVCFDFQIAENVPADEWDVPMDYVISEDELITPSRKDLSR
ncbi:MAG: 5-formyltetrahydrofolate cyclo-ligase [Bacteroidales bacterium]|jgi:5-formyltetrahydrofolate cyclo-ligase|nr:5-formyltetrahydrofolate cyclo-ligase [Bacteroidales bacterium]MDD3160311.1 5-formyltetrahydrofolate cyclo-ligase [Bacteroidales bacterium]